MKLHENNTLFSQSIQFAARVMKIQEVFIEKDYWITLVLKQLSQSKYNNSVVFKGDTSLSKGYKIINRFSEDIDIAVLNVSELSGNQVKNLIRDVEKDISANLKDIPDHEGTSKGSRFRKSFYTFPISGDPRLYQAVSDKLIIEINSFANPFPFENREIVSLISSALTKNNQNELIKKYELMPFTLKVLHKNQTMLEKLVSLFRSSFENNAVAGVSGKIRHFFDLYYLINDKECMSFIGSDDFKVRFKEIWDHDQKAFDEPIAWKGKSVKESPLYIEFSNIWDSAKLTYFKELPALAFSPVPKEEDVVKTMNFINKNLSHII
ncbi:MAG: nucleotidyl transferase AbiEii/AbiGii toxin family protein [Bacteroidota bacterium]